MRFIFPVFLLLFLSACAANARNASATWVGAHIDEAIDHFGIPETTYVRDRTFYSWTWAEGGTVVANTYQTGFGNSMTVTSQAHSEYCTLSMEIDEEGFVMASNTKGNGTKCFDVATFGKMKRPFR